MDTQPRVRTVCISESVYVLELNRNCILISQPLSSRFFHAHPDLLTSLSPLLFLLFSTRYSFTASRSLFLKKVIGHHQDSTYIISS